MVSSNQTISTFQFPPHFAGSNSHDANVASLVAEEQRLRQNCHFLHLRRRYCYFRRPEAILLPLQLRRQAVAQTEETQQSTV